MKMLYDRAHGSFSTEKENKEKFPIQYSFGNFSKGSKDYLERTLEIVEKAIVIQRKGLFDTFEQLYKFGPVHDGNILSKPDKSLLVELEVAERIVVNGHEGYTAINSLGSVVYDICLKIRGKENEIWT